MPKGSAAVTRGRRDEIINACEKLYETMSFKDITIKEIGSATSFTRTSIYNYFQTKEEIFLALLQREYEAWVDDLHHLAAEHDALSTEALADALARSLERRALLLKLMSMNNFDMEANSSDERLAAFKRAYGASLEALDKCLCHFRPAMTAPQRESFLYAFLPFVYGIYPYTTVSEKQAKAMETAQVPFVRHTIYELVVNAVLNLLHDEKKEG